MRRQSDAAPPRWLNNEHAGLRAAAHSRVQGAPPAPAEPGHRGRPCCADRAPPIAPPSAAGRRRLQAPAGWRRTCRRPPAAASYRPLGRPARPCARPGLRRRAACRRAARSQRKRAARAAGHGGERQRGGRCRLSAAGPAADGSGTARSGPKPAGRRRRAEREPRHARAGCSWSAGRRAAHRRSPARTAPHPRHRKAGARPRAATRGRDPRCPRPPAVRRRRQPAMSRPRAAGSARAPPSPAAAPRGLGRAPSLRTRGWRRRRAWRPAPLLVALRTPFGFDCHTRFHEHKKTLVWRCSLYWRFFDQWNWNDPGNTHPEKCLPGFVLFLFLNPVPTTVGRCRRAEAAARSHTGAASVSER